jgi:hypothetical protein
MKIQARSIVHQRYGNMVAGPEIHQEDLPPINHSLQKLILM